MKNMTIMLILLVFSVICTLSGCENTNGDKNMEHDDIFSNPSITLLSSSGNYSAGIEEFSDNGVNSYYLFIKDMHGDDDIYQTDIVFRARDRNYVYWADIEDVLWAYSGDIGIFYWTKENASWQINTYSGNEDAQVPQALKNARPRYFD